MDAFTPTRHRTRRFKRPISRTEWRKKIVGKKRTKHGGRGRIYGLKSHKRRRRRTA